MLIKKYIIECKNKKKTLAGEENKRMKKVEHFRDIRQLAELKINTWWTKWTKKNNLTHTRALYNINVCSKFIEHALNIKKLISTIHTGCLYGSKIIRQQPRRKILAEYTIAPKVAFLLNDNVFEIFHRDQHKACARNLRTIHGLKTLQTFTIHTSHMTKTSK